jgi:hypothetical protein
MNSSDHRNSSCWELNLSSFYRQALITGRRD